MTLVKYIIKYYGITVEELDKEILFNLENTVDFFGKSFKKKEVDNYLIDTLGLTKLTPWNLFKAYIKLYIYAKKEEAK